MCVNWYKGGLINRIMDASLTDDAYTFANVRITIPRRLLTIKGERTTYTPLVSPDQSILNTIHENLPGTRVLYPECCSQLLSHLIQKRKEGQRLLDISPHNCEFAIASQSLKNLSYTGVDPRKELTTILENIDADTDRIMFVPSIADSGEEPYDIMIVDLKDITSIPRNKFRDDSIVIIRGTEDTRSSPIFGDCWTLPFVNVYGVVGVRNTDDSCDALFIVSNRKDDVEIPEPVNGKVQYLYKLPESVLPKPPLKSMIAYNGKNVPYLGGHPYACVQYTSGIGIKHVGIILKSSTYNPIEYLSFYTERFVGRSDNIHLHIFEYDSKIPNRSHSYLRDSINLSVHTHSSYNKCVNHAKYVIDDPRGIIGMDSDDDIIDIIADGIGRVMGVEEKMLIEIRGVYDLLSKGIAKAYPRSDLRILMSACDPSTLTYIQSTRDGSKIYTTRNMGKNIPSMIIGPESVEYHVKEYTREELLVLAETNLPQYSRPGKDDDFVPTSPVEVADVDADTGVGSDASAVI